MFTYVWFTKGALPLLYQLAIHIVNTVKQRLLSSVTVAVAFLQPELQFLQKNGDVSVPLFN